MPELFEMLKFISRRRSESGRRGQSYSYSGKTVARVQPIQPPKPSDYEAHHALVEGLERFNGAIEPASLARLKALRMLEQEGLPLQSKVIDQYLRNQDTLKLAKQALWRECHMFWTQMAMAYVNLLKQVVKEPAEGPFKSWMPILALKSIRYTALSFRWGYHQGQIPTLFSWRRMNKLYRVAERAHVAAMEIEEFGIKTTAAREYSLALLLDLAHPIGFKPREIELAANILESLPYAPAPSQRLLKQQHTHGVDLSSGHGAFNLDQGWVPGKRLRYLDFSQIHNQIEQAVLTLPTNEERFFCRQLASIIERGGVRRRGPRAEAKGCYWVAIGMDAIEKILDPQKGGGPKPLLEPWLTRDQSQDGVGFVVADGEPVSAGQLLLASTEPEEHNWQLMVVRWHDMENGKQLVGAQCLSRHPKGVTYELNEQSKPQFGFMLFLPMLDAATGVSNVMLPKSVFKSGTELKLHDGESSYQLRLAGVVEEHGAWMRSGFEVLARESLEKVA
ncbi:MAG: hypothetical protein WBX11_09275 [Thiobacillaceae bacterium]